MSTKKITALTELSAAAAAADMIPIVDVSDTTDAATGTTKKITATNIGKGLGIGDGSTTAEPVKIDTANGRLGIGTASPATAIHLEGADADFQITAADGSLAFKAGQDSDGDGFCSVNNSAGNPRAVFDSDGDSYVLTNVGIGVTAPSHALHVAYNVFPSTFERFAGASTGGSGIIFAKSRGSSAGSYTIVSDGDDLGQLVFKGADGNSWAAAASIIGQVDGTPGDGDMPGRLTFHTTPDWSETATERMRIDSSGNMLLGGTATPASSVGNL